jgi:hypothetical protein
MDEGDLYYLTVREPNIVMHVSLTEPNYMGDSSHIKFLDGPLKGKIIHIHAYDIKY